MLRNWKKRPGFVFSKRYCRVPTLLELTIPIYIKEQCNNFQGIDRLFTRGTLMLKEKWNSYLHYYILWRHSCVSELIPQSTCTYRFSRWESKSVLRCLDLCHDFMRIYIRCYIYLGTRIFKKMLAGQV